MSLTGFDLDSRFVSRLPANDIGDFALADLRRRGLDTRYCVRGGGGDGFAACLIYGLLEWPDDDERALAFGVPFGLQALNLSY